MNEPVLRFAEVDKVFGEGASSALALRGINFTVNAGEFTALIGSPGSGKSSMLAVGGGLDQPTNGEVFVNNTSLGGLGLNESASLRRRFIGYLHQKPDLVPMLTVLENVALPRELDGAPTEVAHGEAETALDKIGIADLSGRSARVLSGAEQQRVALARAVVGDRRLVLADEPTAALGSADGDELLDSLRHLADEGFAVLLTTQETRQTAWADRVLFINDGQIIGESGSRFGSELVFADRYV
ncbi:ABC transporter ATP-binding protein [Arthrobacter sp. H14]|uniref:ABC transporter ATP-binding protein n=1 Tax=Arthrobacter sp. H14 TaxID=1312959 RepID=UPI00047C4D91|nr:ATP-binding cassette domain-containing protein [Arthrobacter sp. H14]